MAGLFVKEKENADVADSWLTTLQNRFVTIFDQLQPIHFKLNSVTIGDKSFIIAITDCRNIQEKINIKDLR